MYIVLLFLLIIIYLIFNTPNKDFKSVFEQDNVPSGYDYLNENNPCAYVTPKTNITNNTYMYQFDYEM